MVQSVVFMVWDTGPSGYWTHEFQTWYRAFMVTGHEGSGYGTGTIWIYIYVCVCVCVHVSSCHVSSRYGQGPSEYWILEFSM